MPLAAIPVMLGVTAAAGIGSAAIGAAGASSAASTQASAANNAAQLQYQSGQNALGFDQEVFNQNQANQAPFIATGQAANSTLANALGLNPQPIPTSTASVPNAVNPSAPQSAATAGAGLPTAPNVASTGSGQTLANGSPQAFGAPATANQPSTQTNIGGVNYNMPTGGGTGTGSLLQPWDQQFQAPTAANAASTPGYQFELQQGENAVQNSAAAQGNLLTGGTLKGLDQYANNMASTNYQQTYNNALTQYQQGYNQFQNNQANTYNRLAGVSGAGQTAATNLNSANNAIAGQVGNTLSTTAGQVGQNLNNAGAANASGYVGVANALSGGLQSTSQAMSLSQLLNQQNNAYQSSPQAVLDYNS